MNNLIVILLLLLYDDEDLLRKFALKLILNILCPNTLLLPVEAEA